jgi:hypothetical protein
VSQQRVDDLLLFGEAALALLREDEPPVGADVELALLARGNARVDPGALQRGRETRGPSVVAASGGAVEDLDLWHGHDHTRRRPLRNAPIFGRRRSSSCAGSLRP